MMDLHNCNCRDTTVTEGIFGEISTAPGDSVFNEALPKVVKSYTLKNCNRMEVTVISWGATITSLKCPDKYGRSADIVLGFDDLKGYTNPGQNPFIGCILGRCANRIKDGLFSMKGKEYQLTKNDLGKQHHLHGGTNGFGRRVWESYISDCCVIMSYLSQDGEEGYPGAMLATVRFGLSADNKLEISMRATTSKPTVTNLSHGSLFNLAGHDAGEEELKQHKILLNCDRWTVSEFLDPIPTGSIQRVGGTIMDLRIPRILGEYMDRIPSGDGYDHNFCVTRNCQPGSLFVAKVWHSNSGRVLEVYSDQPGVQIYTGGRLMPEFDLEPTLSEELWTEAENPIDQIDSFTMCASNPEIFQDDMKKVEICNKDTIAEPENLYITGKNGSKYRKNCAFSIQPQNYPNAINIKNFPCPILYPGQVYCHDLTYKFGIRLNDFT